MSRHAQENLVSLMLLVMYGVVLYLCQDFGPRARLIPLPLAIFGIVLTLVQLGWHNFGREESPPPEMIHVDTSAIVATAEGQPRTERTEEQLGQWGEAGAYAIVALLVGMVFLIGIFPEGSHPPITYPIAVLRTSTNPEAEAFRRFLISREGKAIFARRGFVAR